MASRIHARKNAAPGSVVQTLPAGVVHRHGSLVSSAADLRKNIKKIVDACQPVEMKRYGCVVAVLVPVPDAGWEGTDECKRRIERALRAAARAYSARPAK